MSGQLSLGSRGLTLRTEDALWIIESDEPVDRFVGDEVIVEGNVIGLDRLRADWIGSTGEHAQGA
ncbi:MAG: DUF5818 domain-containing protein [Pseudomonadota bacterium]